MPARLTKEEAHTFLDSRPGWLIFTSLGKDGYPHSVPVGYFRVGDDIYTGGRQGTQRLANIERNTKVSALIETGRTREELKGLMVQGDAAVVTDRDEVLQLQREAARQRGTPDEQLPSEPRPGAAYIRIAPRRYVSWDYSREG